MTRFSFQGTGQTEGLPVKPALELVAAAAVLWWLWTILWVIAVALGVLLALAVAGLVLIRRRPAAEGELLAQRAEALRLYAAQQDRPRLAAAQPPVINHFHGGTHMHLGPGTDAGIIRQALPERDAITITEEE